MPPASRFHLAGRSFLTDVHAWLAASDAPALYLANGVRYRMFERSPIPPACILARIGDPVPSVSAGVLVIVDFEGITKRQQEALFARLPPNPTLVLKGGRCKDSKPFPLPPDLPPTPYFRPPLEPPPLTPAQRHQAAALLRRAFPPSRLRLVTDSKPLGHANPETILVRPPLADVHAALVAEFPDHAFTPDDVDALLRAAAELAPPPPPAPPSFVPPTPRSERRFWERIGDD